MSGITPNTAPTKLPLKHKKFSVIIPAAGMGTRMKSYGPKCLLTIGKTTILENQIKHIHKYIPNPEIIVVGGFQYDKVKYIGEKYNGVKVIYNPDFENTNVTHSIAYGLKHINYGDVIIIYGDLVFNAYTLRAPFGFNSMVLIDKCNTMSKKEVGCIVNYHMLERMMYGLDNKWAQIAYFTGTELKLLKKLCNQPRYNMYFGFESINIIVNSGGKFSAFSPKRMKITDVDSSRDIILAEKMLI